MINIVSGISAVSVAVPVMAMVILLSVFNGFEGLIKEMYGNFDPDILITPSQGKFFDRREFPAAELQSLDGVAGLSFQLEEDVMLQYRDDQFMATMRGVDSMYDKVVPIEGLVREGRYRLRLGDMDEALVGAGVAYNLGIRTNFSDPLIFLIPRSGGISPILPFESLKSESAFPSGIFELESEVDGKYVFVSLDFAGRLLDRPSGASSVSVLLAPGAEFQTVAAQIGDILGPEFKVQTRMQQKEEFYRIMAYERWGIFFIILLVLAVASFSLIGSLVMLIIEKQKDLRTIITMGGNVSLLRGMFIAEGMMIYGLGAVTGMILGIVVVLAQRYFGLVRIGAQTFLIDAYPVELQAVDLLLITFTFTALSYLISLFTVTAMIPKDKIRIS